MVYKVFDFLFAFTDKTKTKRQNLQHMFEHLIDIAYNQVDDTGAIVVHTPVYVSALDYGVSDVMRYMDKTKGLKFANSRGFWVYHFKHAERVNSALGKPDNGYNGFIVAFKRADPQRMFLGVQTRPNTHTNAIEIQVRSCFHVFSLLW